ncbi:hypothetical protein IAU60_006921 [Kwoniella sp. DSM 27419]
MNRKKSSRMRWQEVSHGCPVSALPRQLTTVGAVLKDDRRSALLLAYGRSGSGKTTTIKDVFSSFSNVVYENLPAGAILRVSIVALEFHLKRVYDLQCDRAELTWNRTKPLSDTARSYVVDNSADLIAHMLTIFDRRVTAATVSNANSSRSHTFLELNFEVEVAPRQFEAWGRFGILDLAGSEALDSAAPTIGLDKGIQAVYRTAAAEQKDRAAAQQRNDEGAAIRQELVGISALMRAYASALRSGKTLPNHSFQSSPFLHVLKPYLDRRSSIVGVITLSLWKQFESRQRDILDFGKILASLCTLWTQADRERVAKLRAVSGLKPREETESNHPALTEVCSLRRTFLLGVC